MDVSFMQNFEVSDKVGKRAEAVMELGYVFISRLLHNGKFMLYCVRVDGDQVAAKLCMTPGELGGSVDSIINDAYNILYGEENNAA